MEELKQTRPTKKQLAKVEETDFTLNDQAYKDQDVS